jgi:hypothetical protein
MPVEVMLAMSVAVSVVVTVEAFVCPPPLCNPRSVPVQASLASGERSSSGRSSAQGMERTSSPDFESVTRTVAGFSL